MLLREAEESDEEPEVIQCQSSQFKKSKTLINLDTDEQAIADGLEDIEEDNNFVEEDKVDGGGEGKEGEDEDEGEDVVNGEEEEEEDNGLDMFFKDNNLRVFLLMLFILTLNTFQMEVDVVTSHKNISLPGRRKLNSGKSVSAKITKDLFSSVIGLLADSAKKNLRSKIILGDWVLDTEVGKEEWIWKTITETVKNATSARKSAFVTALHEIKDDDDIKGNLIIFVSTFLL